MDDEILVEEDLGLQAYTQQDLEIQVEAKAEVAMLEQENERDRKLMDKELAQVKSLKAEQEKAKTLADKSIGTAKTTFQKKYADLSDKLNLHVANIQDIENRINQRTKKAAETSEATFSRDRRRPGESKRDYLIRKGIINPFTNKDDFEEGEIEEDIVSPVDGRPGLSFQNLKAPGFAPANPKQSTKDLKLQKITLTAARPTSTDTSPEPNLKLPSGSEEEEDDTFHEPSPMKRRRVEKGQAVATKRSTKGKKPVHKKDDPSHSSMVAGFEGDYEPAGRSLRIRRATGPVIKIEESDDDKVLPQDDGSDDYKVEEAADDSEDDVKPEGSDDEEMPSARVKKNKGKKTKKRRSSSEEFESEEEVSDLSRLDDGYEEVYQQRLKSWCAKRAAARSQVEGDDDVDSKLPEWLRPSPSAPDFFVDEGFKIPGDIAQSLFDYQKTCANWLWNLHAKQHTGGILGDEMGLGKTIQMIAFIAGLHYSQKLTKPVLVVSPSTVMKQWCNEFHKWWPPLRVSILHQSGSGMRPGASDRRLDDEDEEDLDAEERIIASVQKKTGRTKQAKAASRIVEKVKAKGHVLVTTYEGLKTYSDLLADTEWECVALDEGHRIRNPNARTTQVAKWLRSPTRFIMSGTPIQNNLTELWSLFDFVYPGKLGILPVFKEHIAVPIKLGGYANATNIQIHAAFKCAMVLRDMIGPYILRRLKADVAVLPPKQDQVLFCNLVRQQKEAYETYISSPEVSAIIDGKRDVLAGIDILRKICNHPDLCDRDKLMHDPEYKYGNPVKSGKMQIVKALLKKWELEGSKSLIFSQGKMMLDILETFVKKAGYTYLRMDGDTNITSRQTMVDKFNSDPRIKVFLLTTRVGGFGVNLTGATRIIIYDPDWNPSNDMQARERAWRLGQKEEVRIYRLLSRGTIEEKVYQRQLYKQFLTKKILEDPEQRRVFKLEDMHDLFTYGNSEGETETGALFQGVERMLDHAKNAAGVLDDDHSKQIQEIAGVEALENFVDTTENFLSGSSDPKTSTNAPNESSVKPSPSKGKKTKYNKTAEDDQLLESLLAQAGVHSIVEHDEIMTASKSTTNIIEREAERVASAARDALTRSFDVVSKYSVGTATWTGKTGKGGKVASKDTKSAAASAGSSRISKGKNTTPVKGKQTPGSLSSVNKIEAQIRDFLNKRGGKANTQQILWYFNPLIAPHQKDDFKEALKKAATKNKDIWTVIK